MIQALLKDRGDDTEVALLYANQSPDDILLLEELQEMAKDPRVKVWYTGARRCRLVAWSPCTRGTTESQMTCALCGTDCVHGFACMRYRHRGLAAWPQGWDWLCCERCMLCICAVDRVPEGMEWAYSTGFVSEDMVREHLFPAGASTIALMCGPPPMIKFACMPNLEKLGYVAEDCITF